MRQKLGDLLVKNKVISKETLKKALIYQEKLKQKGKYKRLGEVLQELGLVDEKTIINILSKQLNIPIVDVFDLRIDYNLISHFPTEYMEKELFFPFKIDENYIHIVLNDPLDYDLIFQIEKMSNKMSKLYLSYKYDILVILERTKIYSSIKNLINKILNSSSDANVIDELIDTILKNAINFKATDLHIEAQRHDVLIRARVDGVLKEVFTLEKDVYSLLVSKIKILSNLDIAERRKPQDGRFSRVIDEKRYNIRVSTVPTIFGESIVLRILDEGKILLKITELGMSKYNLKRFEKLINLPYGIVFVTGPTGSGKTTTLYAALNEIKSIENKIITVEDPVEYELPLIQQIPINPSIGVTFAVALKSILRQDPDIIMIGEIRDFETLNIAVQAALTGHLVFATLHTNDAISTISRMKQLGIQDYMIADSLNGIVAQRLIRKICPHCKTEYIPSKEKFELVRPFLKEKIRFFKGEGCKKCNFTGYLGREMINEVLCITPGIAHLIALGKDKREILIKAKEEGFITMIEDGIQKIIQGKTTIDEILRVAKANEIL